MDMLLDPVFPAPQNMPGPTGKMFQDTGPFVDGYDKKTEATNL